MDYYLDLNYKKSPRILKPVEITCEGCGKKFLVPKWMADKGRRFCSTPCRRQDPFFTLLKRVEIQCDGTDCWNYTGTIGWSGYGQLKVGQTNYSAHKLMWMLWNDAKVPRGKVVRHTCVGNPRCINPDHLNPGTQKQNIGECIAQGRFKLPCGKKRASAGVDDETVRKIRALRQPGEKRGGAKYTYKQISEMLGVPRPKVRQIIYRQTWKHLV